MQTKPLISKLAKKAKEGDFSVLIMNIDHHQKHGKQQKTKETDTALEYANYTRNNNNVRTIAALHDAT